MSGPIAQQYIPDDGSQPANWTWDSSFDVEEMISRLGPQEVARLRALRGEPAREVLNSLQSWLDANPHHQCRRRVLYVIVKLGSASHEVPQNFFAKGMNLLTPDPTLFGAFADISRGTYRGVTVAVKRLRINENQETRTRILKQFFGESLIWRQMRHPNILPLLGIDAKAQEDAQELTMISSWMERGTLMEYLCSNDYTPHLHRLHLIYGVADGLYYLHSKNLAHGKLNGTNIYVSLDGRPCIASCFTDITWSDNSTQGRALRLSWLAPELVLLEDNAPIRCTPQSDVFSYGRVCPAICSRRRPFDGDSDMVILKRLIEKQSASRPPESECDGWPISEELWNLMMRCWADIPMVRPTMTEVVHELSRLNHPGTQPDSDLEHKSQLSTLSPEMGDLEPNLIKHPFQSSAISDDTKGPGSSVEIGQPTRATRRRAREEDNDENTHPVKRRCHTWFNVDEMMNKLLGPNKENEKVLLAAYRGEEAVEILNSLQVWLDVNHEHEHRRRVIKIMIDIASASTELPTSLFLDGIDLLSMQPSGLGYYSDVFRGTYEGKPVAVKRLRIKKNKETWAVTRKQFCKEGLTWRQLKHPNILPFLGVDANTSGECRIPMLISLWMERGTLMDYLGSSDYTPYIHRPRLICEVADGLHYLHSQNLVHGDLHGDNIFISADGRPYIADFGLVVITNITLSPNATGGALGAIPWSAPELCLAEDNTSIKKTLEADVFSYGRICLAICTGQRPFHETPDIAVLMRIFHRQNPPRPTDSQCGGVPISEELWNLITECWEYTPPCRPTMAELVGRLYK